MCSSAAYQSASTAVWCDGFVGMVQCSTIGLHRCSCVVISGIFACTMIGFEVFCPESLPRQAARVVCRRAHRRPFWEIRQALRPWQRGGFPAVVARLASAFLTSVEATEFSSTNDSSFAILSPCHGPTALFFCWVIAITILLR